MKRAVLLGGTVAALACVIVGIYLTNYFRLQAPMNRTLRTHSRCDGITIRVHYGNYLNPSTLVFDVGDQADKTRSGDVLVALYRFSSLVPLEGFQTVELRSNGSLVSLQVKEQLQLQRVIENVIVGDERNKGVEVLVYLRDLSQPAFLTYDLQGILGEKSMLDVTRVFFQFSEQLKAEKYEQVDLCYRGERRFNIAGEYFQKLGKEFSWQNPVYTMRTLPENLKKPDGAPAYGTWTGGWIGVTGKQMEDFNDFHSKWYLADFVASNAKK